MIVFCRFSLPEAVLITAHLDALLITFVQKIKLHQLRGQGGTNERRAAEVLCKG